MAVKGSLEPMRNRRLWLPMTLAVLAVWLVGTWVTKYSLQQMAILAPVAMVVVGLTIALPLLWVKIVRDSLRERRGHDR
jgi:hypothetical protein